MSKLDKFIKALPKEWAPATNPMLNALLQAWAGSDDEIMQQLQNTKAQLFVKTAEGTYLDRLASNYGVERPFALGLLDSDFQELIPNLSLKQKQIVKSFYDTMDVFWGPSFSRAGQQATSNEPYNVVLGDSFSVIIDGDGVQTVTVGPGDIQVPGAATVLEVSRIIGKLSGIVTETIIDQLTGAKRLYFRTDTAGIRGSIEFVSGFGAFGIIQGVRYRVTALPQRTVLYQIKPGEILIELPAIVPTLRRTLRGSHHFHETAAIEPAIPPSNTVWQGSFVYSKTTNPFVPTAVKCRLLSTILKGSVINQITVDDASAFPKLSGKLILDFGKDTQEQPVSYITVPNDHTILVDPGYSFQQTHLAGSYVNVLMPNQTVPYAPRAAGEDLAVYLTSPANARALVQDILASLTAAGITVTFLVLLPTYKYLIDNPYASDVVLGVTPEFTTPNYLIP